MSVKEIRIFLAKKPAVMNGMNEMTVLFAFLMNDLNGL